MNTEFRIKNLKDVCNCSLRKREGDHKFGYDNTSPVLSSDTAQTSDHSIVLVSMNHSN